MKNMWKILSLLSGKHQKEFENDDKTILHGYPAYPSNEDIYNKEIQEIILAPDNGKTKKQTFKINIDENNKKIFKDDKSDSDLNFLGFELNYEKENAGNEG